MIAAIPEIIAIVNAQYLPKDKVNKPPKWPAMAPSIERQITIPVKKESATEKPVENLSFVFVLTIPAIPNPTGNVQGQIAHATTPAPNATRKLVEDPCDNACSNWSKKVCRFIPFALRVCRL